jgi:hypothetical protein
MDSNSELLALENILHQKVLLLKTFAAICANALNCLENDDIAGFSEKLDERQALLDGIIEQNNRYSSIVEGMQGEYGQIIRKFSEPGAGNMIFPDQCKTLRRYFVEAVNLEQTCKLLNDRLKARAQNVRNNILSDLNSVRVRRKINCGYRINNDAKGSVISYKSN